MTIIKIYSNLLLYLSILLIPNIEPTEDANDLLGVFISWLVLLFTVIYEHIQEIFFWL